jgi:hypothetical protein
MADLIRHKRSSVQSAVPTTLDLSLGELSINTYDGKLFIKKDDGSESIVEFREPRLSFKSITVESPTSSEDITLFKVPYGIRISSLVALVQGSTPSVTWTLRYASDRSTTGTEVITSGTTTTNSTTGETITAFSSSSISTSSFIWLETTAVSGTVSEFNLTITYSVD